MVEAKKNERVAGDLEEKKALLAKTKKELDELQSSKVGSSYGPSNRCRLLNLSVRHRWKNFRKSGRASWMTEPNLMMFCIGWKQERNSLLNP
jgi:hypothetical protein